MGYQDEDELSEEGFLEMLADYDKLGKLQEQYRELPHSPQRVELCRRPWLWRTGWRNRRSR